MTWMQVAQWFLLIWLVSLFIRSVLEIFNLDNLDHMVTGIIFVLIGLAWIASLQWKFNISTIFFPYFIQSAIGLILASYGIKMIWKKPIGSVVACVVMALVFGFLYYRAPVIAKNDSSFVSQYFPFLSSQVISPPFSDNQTSVRTSFGKETDETLFLISTLGNLVFSSSENKSLFTVDTGTIVEEQSGNIYKIANAEEKTSIRIRNWIKEFKISKDVGNIRGTLDGTYEIINLNSDAGNIHLDLKGKIESFICNVNMGNLDLNLYSLISSMKIKLDVGNITIHIPKGMQVETDSIKTNVGKIKIEQNGDGSLGSIKLEAETNLGNITIIADL
ncbi:MAG: hypothetical protein PHD83_00410 [Caldisericia bacterium]|nr:hypothetical protein [Caldisericia bacterium]